MRFLRELMTADYLRSRDAFLLRHRWGALLARLPGPEMPRKFSSKEASIATREVAVLKSFNPDATVVYSLEKTEKNADPRILCGRGLTADVVINQESISKHHTAFEQRDGHWLIRDLGSTNGTYVESVRMADGTEQPLRDAAKVRLGECAVEFYPADALYDLLLSL